MSQFCLWHCRVPALRQKECYRSDLESQVIELVLGVTVGVAADRPAHGAYGAGAGDRKLNGVLYEALSQ